MFRRSLRLRPSRLITTSVVALGLALAACGDDTSGGAATTAAITAAPTTAAAAPATTTGPDLSKVELTIAVETSSLGDLAIREASKAFEGTPYTITWAKFDSTPLAIEALNAKAVDAVMDASTQNLLLAAGNAEPAWTTETAPFAIASINETTDDDAAPSTIVHADSGITDFAGLVGKKVAFTSGTLSHYYLVYAAGELGIDLDSIEQVKMSSADARAAFAAGEVDAVVVAVRQGLNVLSKGNAVKLPVVGGVLKSYRGLVVRRGVLDDPAVEAAMADFILRSEANEAWVRANPEAVAAILVEADKLDAATAAAVALVIQRKTVPISAAVLAEFQRQGEAFLAQGVITNPIDLSVIFDQRYNSIIPAG